MTDRSGFFIVVAGLILAVGIAIAGWRIGQGFVEGREPERIVTVKGVSEREVKADLALWRLRFVSTGDDLIGVQAKVVSDEARVRAFLVGNGLPKETIELRGLEVTDLLAQTYRSGPLTDRFIVAATLMVRTNDVNTVDAASQRVGDLIADGVVLSGQGGGPVPGPAYLFTRLNDIKPAMIEEATENARKGAEQFADHSGSHVGAIYRANQGLFQILPRDDVDGAREQDQMAKTVRVVSTIDYSLAD
ncbi:MAG: SIMPL domain-containing protein [Rhodospirillales bacterium]|nr:SIMPL domain-containing protein [Rhodospirillales bacterium]